MLLSLLSSPELVELENPLNDLLITIPSPNRYSYKVRLTWIWTAKTPDQGKVTEGTRQHLRMQWNGKAQCNTLNLLATEKEALADYEMYTFGSIYWRNDHSLPSNILPGYYSAAMESVLVSWNFHHKFLQNWWFKTTNYFLTVSEARREKSSVDRVSLPSEMLIFSCLFQFLVVPRIPSRVAAWVQSLASSSHHLLLCVFSSSLWFLYPPAFLL